MVGQLVEIFNRSFLHDFKILLSRSSADNDGDMIRRTGSRAECLHLLDKERNESLRVDKSLCLLIEISLVGRTAALRYEQEFILIAITGMNINLRREITSGIDLVIHIQGGVLAIAEIIGSICVIHTVRDIFLIVSAGPDRLAFGSVNYSSAGVLTERELTHCSDLGIAQHCECHKLIVLAGFGVRQDFGHHLVMLATQHKGIVVCCLTRQNAQCLRIDHEHLVTVPILNLDIV